jgi:hypothetical protein
MQTKDQPGTKISIRENMAWQCVPRAAVTDTFKTQFVNVVQCVRALDSLEKKQKRIRIFPAAMLNGRASSIVLKSAGCFIPNQATCSS